MKQCFPNWPVLFVGESLTLSCEVEGADTQWTYEWSRSRLNPPPTTREYTVSRVTESDTGAYSCRAQRGPHLTTVWSTTSVSVLSRAQVTVRRLSEVQTGGSVVLLCSVSPLSSGWKYEWSRNEQLFNQSSSEAQVSVSEGGEYQCRASRGESPDFTEHSPKFTLISTGAPRGESSSLSVMWVVGPVCALVLLITLLLLWRFLKTKELCFPRTNQSSAEDHVTNNDHASPPNDVTYAMIEFKNKRERNNSAQGVLCDVNPHSSGTGKLLKVQS
ncbi:uncharacterized protein LOC129408861 [Boleophthalmus pectinirostris]|uniref:uncharacterized protein LOC129408861 n=1 Tax=Boleophthalmus pectinirostris TaxID=150288 RepID=UPI00242A4C89|nr:uncharacterized protein LOC129408861 [Boleophthalmus pectinirostris]